jgi:hypothetical protein
MSDTDILDADVVPEAEPMTLALATTAPVALAVTPQVGAGELVQRLAVISEAMHTAMQDGVDYGLIPGVNKPTLLKPGAEKLGVLFQLDIQLVNEKTWGPGDHLTVTSHATVFHAPTGSRLGYGEGLCTTRERKYAYRNQKRTCPSCGAAAVIKGKQEYGGGWLCFKKQDGCGAKWPDGAAEIEGQEVGEIDNPDLPDLWNTTIKMAEKRARVDAVLAVTGASALFTQDAEDAPKPAAQVGPEFGDPISPDAHARVRAALNLLLAPDLPRLEQPNVEAMWETLANDSGGYFPRVVGRSLLFIAAELKRRLEFTPESDVPNDFDTGAT